MTNKAQSFFGFLATVSLLALAQPGFAQDSAPSDGSVLPFPPVPLESIAAPTLGRVSEVVEI